MWTETRQKPLMLKMHSFVFSFICVDKQGRVHEEYYEEYYALIQYANHISHYFPLKKKLWRAIRSLTLYP